MPRVARAWYRSGRKMWFGHVNGQQTPLGVTDPAKQEIAQLVLEQLLAEIRPALAPVPAAAPPPPLVVAVPTVADLADGFLAKKKTKVSAGCWRQYDITLRVHFVPVFGRRPANTLTAEELEEWADRAGWSSSTRNNNLGTVSTFLKWAKYPLAVKRPPKESRGADAVLSDDDFAAVLAGAVAGNYGGDLRELLRVLRETGARPQEVARLTVESVDWVNSCARLKQHKTRHHGHDRTIHFSAAAAAILAAQRDRYQSGFLFRTRAGNAFSGPAIVKRVAKVSERTGVKATAYGLGRHSFATKALVAGVPDAVVAELLGHKGTAMVARHYGHVSGQAKVLKAAVERVSAPAVPKAG